MARTPKPWFDNERKVWKVTINGRRHSLGEDKKLAMEEFHRLMIQPAKKKVPTHSLPAIVDAFLTWVHKHLAPDTFEWYRYRLQRFVESHRDLRLQDLRPFHVENWVDCYDTLSKTSRRNYIRSVKRCFIWATKQGYLDRNPVDNLEAPAADRKEIVISEDEYQKILRSTPDEGLRDLIAMARTSLSKNADKRFLLPVGHRDFFRLGALPTQRSSARGRARPKNWQVVSVPMQA